MKSHHYLPRAELVEHVQHLGSREILEQVRKTVEVCRIICPRAANPKDTADVSLLQPRLWQDANFRHRLQNQRRDRDQRRERRAEICVSIKNPYFSVRNRPFLNRKS